MFSVTRVGVETEGLRLNKFRIVENLVRSCEDLRRFMLKSPHTKIHLKDFIFSNTFSKRSKKVSELERVLLFDL